MKLTYLWLDLGTLLFPLLLSFDKKVAFYKNWRFLFPAMAIVGLLFLIWDVLFTRLGIWSFNPSYVMGNYLLNLPIEEVLFFLVVPYACVFVYECLLKYLPQKKFHGISVPMNLIVMGICIAAIYFYYDRLYTAVVAVLLLFTLLWHMAVSRAPYLGTFYLAWFICIIPMLIINGVLTALPVVIYNNAENIGFRTGTIPIEDYFYNMICMLWNVMLYEAFRKKKRLASSEEAQAANP